MDWFPDDAVSDELENLRIIVINDKHANNCFMLNFSNAPEPSLNELPFAVVDPEDAYERQKTV